MNGIIVLEGPDCVGKTTLQEYLVTHHQAVPIHLTYPAPSQYRDMWDYQLKEMQRAISLSKTELVVVDRHWLSEQIYSKIFRSGTHWPYMGRMFDRVWCKHAAIYVVCLPFTIEDTVKRHRENLDPGHPYPDDKFMELVSAYVDYACASSDRFDHVSYTIEVEGKNLASFCVALLDRLRIHRLTQYQPALLAVEQNILGHRADAKYLLVGEQVNQCGDTYAWPFVKDGNCSAWLTNVLIELNIDESQLMWTNVFDEHGDVAPHVGNLIGDLPLRPIAFGQIAKMRLQRLKAPAYFSMMHPSYAKRFDKKAEFMAQLTTAFEEVTWR
jgi:thymidylate kinase